MTHDVTETDLPGIGRSYTVAASEGGRLLVVLHHSGRRDLYVLPDDEDDDPKAIVTFTDDQARRLGSILSGAYFKPAAVAQVEAVIGGLLIDWATVREDSPGRDRSIEELAIRRRTRMTVAAIVHPDGSSVVAPEPTAILGLGDQLVVVGRPEDLPAFLQLVID